MAITQEYHSDQRFFQVRDVDILKFAARQWRTYHELVHHVAAAERALSIHMLQPNPFVPGSKQLTAREFELVNNSYPIQSFVVDGYPKLRRAVNQLQSESIIADGLTQIYKDTLEEIWIDSAHVNEKGQYLVIEQIIARIKAAADGGSRPRE